MMAQSEWPGGLQAHVDFNTASRAAVKSFPIFCKRVPPGFFTFFSSLSGSFSIMKIIQTYQDVVVPKGGRFFGVEFALA